MDTFYLEYKIIDNRPGLMGNVASLLGLFDANILTIASIEKEYRGFLLEFKDDNSKDVILNTLSNLEDLKVTKFKDPTLFDMLALKHGKKLKFRKRDNLYTFQREDLDLLIDFLSEHLQKYKYILIGFKGSPRIGKTETAITAAVHANKHWELLSTTLLRKITRTRISEDKLDFNTVFIIDAVTTFKRATAKHINFIKGIIKNRIPRIIEHPEIFIQETDYEWEDFDLVVELTDEDVNEKVDQYLHSYNSFDIS